MAEYNICVKIGELPIQLRTSDEAFLRMLDERFAGFISEGRADCLLEVSVCEPGGNKDPDADVCVERVGEIWRITRGDFEAEWNFQTRYGCVRQVASPYSIDTVLRIIHSLELAKCGGFLLHASSVIRNGRAFLFSGVSGAGKTTISRLLPSDAILLTDEISYVRFDGQVFHACGTPFAGDLAKPGENVSAPILDVFLLAQGPENRIDDVEPVMAARSLLRNILFFAKDPALTDALLNTAVDFVTRMPVRRLTFFPDQRVWDLIS